MFKSIFSIFRPAAEKQIVQAAPAPVPNASIPAEKTPAYLIGGDGNITITWRSRTYSVGKSHPKYISIVEVLKQGERFGRLDNMLDIAKAVSRGGVTVNEFGEVFYNGAQIHTVLAKKIGELVRANMPYDPFVRFMENLMQNPSQRSIDELYGFLEHQGMPITTDGCFIAYKGITEDWKDKHTKQFDNSIGAVNEMPRENVDPNQYQTCSYGFHVGTHAYAKDFAGADGRLVLVKVNPRDAVSVPADHDASKLRVCRYEVIEVCDKLLEQPLYVRPGEITPEQLADFDLMEIEQEGYDAYSKGILYNPYDESDANEAWEKGWVKADNDMAGAYQEGMDNYDPNEEPRNPYALNDPMHDAWNDGWDDAVALKTPKRAACTYCGAKGGKKHAGSCRRPQKK